MVTIKSRQVTRFSMAAKVYAETLINQKNVNYDLFIRWMSKNNVIGIIPYSNIHAY